MENSRLGIASAAISAFLLTVHLCHLCLILIDPMAWFFWFPLFSLYLVGGLASLCLSIAAALQKNRDVYYAKLGAVLLMTIPGSFCFNLSVGSILEAVNLKHAFQLTTALWIMVVVAIGWVTIQKSRNRSAKSADAAGRPR